MNTPVPSLPPVPIWREVATESMRYWEQLRFIYNGVLLLVFLYFNLRLLWVPHHPFTFGFFLKLLVLAVGANVLYSSAYLVDAYAQISGVRHIWLRFRFLLFLFGTFFASCLAWKIAWKMARKMTAM